LERVLEIIFGALPGKWDLFKDPAVWTFLLRGLFVTIQMSTLSIAISLVAGTLLALLRVSPIRPLAWVAVTYIELVRALPSFLIIFYTFLVAPKFGVDLNPFWSGVAGLSIYTSAVMAEFVRAGILSVHKGLIEASRSLGLSYLQTTRLIILPVALRRMTPSLVGQSITLNKDTSLAALITVPELTSRGRILFQTYFNPIETLLVVATLYFVVNYALSVASRRLEERRT
jgi:aspartate/glutamate/glutamine transport system permease protein